MSEFLPYTPLDENMPAFSKAYETDAGYDMYAVENTVIWPFQTKKVSVNVRICLDEGRLGLLLGRSGNSSKGLLVHPGVIDTGYTGVMKAVITNVSWKPRIIKKGQRIAQLLILDVPTINFVRVPFLPRTPRGTAGFGSSG